MTVSVCIIHFAFLLLLFDGNKHIVSSIIFLYSIDNAAVFLNHSASICTSVVDLARKTGPVFVRILFYLPRQFRRFATVFFTLHLYVNI